MAAWRGLSWLRVNHLTSSMRYLSTTLPTGAAAQQSVKAPVQVFGLEGRYAHALFSAASKKTSLEKVEGELKDFQKLMQDSPALAGFINNPTIRKQQKQSALAENNRLTKVSGVIKAFGTIMSAYRGEVNCVVTTAKTDPALIGGMIVSIGDKYIDMSTATKIKKIVQSMEQGL
ncbi:ATP synthase subunit O, mitochondrial-like [Gigantopelta aegis]|uniref:ATP synthase subunit O, mitochondrial-like n=1 Tax=Gigantopelta aegis TaxID=1735272 RepID=UPI001B889E73|nr:ATP synthase subunit O, mitochondrial-like [Gigantopelta aegis]